jgi:hypothetical protein
MSAAEISNQQSNNSIHNSRKYHPQKIMLSLLGLGIIAISLVFFTLSINKTYIGATFSLTSNGWIVQSVDAYGLAEQTGKSSGDVPTKINGQSAEDFLKNMRSQANVLAQWLQN